MVGDRGHVRLPGRVMLLLTWRACYNTADRHFKLMRRMLAPLPAGGIRWETSIYLNRQCEGKPVARLSASLLSTRYTLKPTTSCMPTGSSPASCSDTTLQPAAARAPELLVAEGSKPGFWRRKRAVADASLKAAEAAAAAAGVPANLADVQYSKRVQGFMRPRK